MSDPQWVVPQLAVISYAAPNGEETYVLNDGAVCEFGRASTCPVRFGYSPISDSEVPRIAGRLIAAGERVIVESTVSPGSRAIEVMYGTRTRQIPIHEAWSPPTNHFIVIVRTQKTLWRLEVLSRTREAMMRASNMDPPTTQVLLHLNEIQEKVLEAYYAPIRAGLMEPATHKEVAAKVHYSHSYVRKIMDEIWRRLFELGVPMIDLRSDKVAAVVEAVRVHELLPPE